MLIENMKIISDVSFIYLLVNFLLYITENKPMREYIFFWLIIFEAYLYFRKRISNKYVRVVVGILCILPIFLIKNTISQFVVALILGFLTYINIKNKNGINYGETVSGFKKCLILSVIITLICHAAISADVINEFILPYAILYILATVILIRYLRNYENNAADKTMSKINIIYSITIISTSVLIALKSVRQAILNALLSVYTFVTKYMLYALIWIIMKIYNVLVYILRKMGFKAIKQEQYEIMKKKPDTDQLQMIDVDFSTLHPLLYRIICITAYTVLVLFILYFLIRLFKRTSSAILKKEECTETKEFIHDEEHPNGLINKFRKLFAKNDSTSKIRFYYKKYMMDCVKEGITIEKHDTTETVYKKSKETFNQKILSDMRKIYLKIRYADKEGTKQEEEEFLNLYKNK